MVLGQVVYEEGWIVKSIESAAKEFDSWPTSIKEALKIETTKDNDDRRSIRTIAR
jgi:hypothetical protein